MCNYFLARCFSFRTLVVVFQLTQYLSGPGKDWIHLDCSPDRINLRVPEIIMVDCSKVIINKTTEPSRLVRTRLAWGGFWWQPTIAAQGLQSHPVCLSLPISILLFLYDYLYLFYQLYWNISMTSLKHYKKHWYKVSERSLTCFNNIVKRFSTTSLKHEKKNTRKMFYKRDYEMLWKCCAEYLVNVLRIEYTCFGKMLNCFGTLSASLHLTLLQHFIKHFYDISPNVITMFS